MHAVTRLLLFVCGVGAIAAPAPAQDRDLIEVSIEELMNIEITSASRREQHSEDVAAAVFVITQDDISRSGMTTIPDLLRLAPGVDVAQVNATNWAVSVRGFNGTYANKLLVLIDGRSIYNRIFSGVLWDSEVLMLDDIERIEVIRGPGATTWGANAVNGVINIITKAAADTQGGLIRVDAGIPGEQAAARYGGVLGSARYRLYSQWTGRAQSLTAPGIGANDASHSLTAGFRTDWTRERQALSVDGNFTSGYRRALWSNLDPQTAARQPISTEPSEARGGHILGRWTHTGDNGSSMQVQSFVNFASLQEPIAHYERQTFDVDSQYHKALGAHHQLVVGSGFRVYRDRYTAGVGFALTPAADRSSLLTAFIGDEIALFENRLAITLGSQGQYDSDSGAGLQPTARAMWMLDPHQRVWAATSRALRTPSRYERGIEVDLPPAAGPGGLPLLVTALGTPALETETFVDVEAGYRVQIRTAMSVDLTAFAGRYDHLTTLEPSSPVIEFVPSPQVVVTSRFGNGLKATTRGFEAAANWSPTPQVRLKASYTFFDLTPQLSPGSMDPLAAVDDGSAPRTQWQLRSTLLPFPRATLSVALAHVGPLQRMAVAGYTRADVTAEWRFASRLSVMAIGQDLFDAAHAEFATAGGLNQATLVRRSASLRLRWTFR